MTVSFAAWPTASVKGAVKPETPTPVPDHVTLEIVALWFPVLDSCSVWVAWLPTATLPKAIAAGEAVSAAAVRPVPLRGTSEGESEALLVIVIVPVSWLPTVGLKIAETVML